MTISCKYANTIYEKHVAKCDKQLKQVQSDIKLTTMLSAQQVAEWELHKKFYHWDCLIININFYFKFILFYSDIYSEKNNSTI